MKFGLVVFAVIVSLLIVGFTAMTAFATNDGPDPTSNKGKGRFCLSLYEDSDTGQDIQKAITIGPASMP